MTTDSLLPLLLGPAGLLVGLLYLVWQQKKELDTLNEAFRSGGLVPKERLDEMRLQRDKALELADKAIDSSDSTARGVEERNRLETQRLERSRGLSDQMTADEDQITRRPKS